jgi:hypothetical protein
VKYHVVADHGKPTAACIKYRSETINQAAVNLRPTPAPSKTVAGAGHRETRHHPAGSGSSNIASDHRAVAARPGSTAVRQAATGAQSGRSGHAAPVGTVLAIVGGCALAILAIGALTRRPALRWWQGHAHRTTS